MRDAAYAAGLRDGQFTLLPKPIGLHRIWPAACRIPRRLIDEAHRVVCWTEGASQIVSLLGCAHVVRKVEAAACTPFAQQVITASHTSASTEVKTRSMLRERWRVGPDTIVLALLADEVERGDAGSAMMAVALAHEACRATQPGFAELRLLCHPLARQRMQASQLSELLGMDRLLIQDAAIASPWSSLAGCDAGIAPCAEDAGLSILWAQAWGLPTFVPEHGSWSARGFSSRIVSARSGLPRDLADAITAEIKSRAAISVSPVSTGSRH